MNSGSPSDPRTLARLRHLELRSRAIADSLLPGRHPHPRPGWSVEFSQHREYSPGDDLRHVDWKATARADRLLIRRFQDETSLAVRLIVDASPSMSVGDRTETAGSETGPTKFRAAAEIAAALAWIVVRGRDAVGLELIGGEERVEIEPSDEPSQWRRIAERLAQVEPRSLERPASSTATASDTSVSGESLWYRGLRRAAERIAPGSVVIAISDWVDDPEPLAGWLRLLGERRRCDLRAVQILTRDELELPDLVDALFTNVEGGNAVRIDAASLRRVYAERVRSELERLERTFGAHGATYRRGTVDEDPVPLIRELLLPGNR